jgi:hypothetical protein
MTDEKMSARTRQGAIIPVISEEENYGRRKTEENDFI